MEAVSASTQQGVLHIMAATKHLLPVTAMCWASDMQAKTSFRSQSNFKTPASVANPRFKS